MHYWGDGGEAIRRIKAVAVVTPYILQVTKDCDDDDDGGDHDDDKHNHDDESHNHNDDNDRSDDHLNALVTPYTSLGFHPQA